MNGITVNFTEEPGEPQRFAAEELKDFLSRCGTEADVSVSMHRDPSMEEGEYSITGSGRYQITAGSDAGLLYGSYELLRQFGFRFFGPDPWDTVIPEKKIVPSEVQVRVKPGFELRGFFAVEKRDTPEFLLWMARHGMNLWTSAVHHPELCRKLGMKLRGNPPSGMHRLFADFLPPEKYAEAHPEWYALHEGKRMTGNQVWGDTWNICMTCDEGVLRLCRNIADALNPGGVMEDADAFTFAPFDGGQWCECERCLASGNRTARLLRIANVCSRMIREKVARPVRLIVPAYHETLAPPDRELPDFDYERIAIEFFPIERCYAHRIDDPACPGNAKLRKFYEAWGKLKHPFKMSIGEYYNVSRFASAAFVFDDTIPSDMDYYRRTGSRFMDYMHVSTALWGELALTNCAFADALSGRQFDPDDFLTKRYGKAAETMRECYACLRRFSHISKPLFHYVSTGDMRPNGWLRNFSVALALDNYRENRPLTFPGHLEEDVSTPESPSLREALELLHKAQALLNSADPGGDDRVRRCLGTDKMRLDATVRRAELTVAFLHLIQAEKAGKKEEAKRFALQIREVAEIMRLDTVSIAHIRAEGAPNLSLYVNALTATQLQRLYAEKMKEYGLAVRPFDPEEGVKVEQG